MNQAIRISVTGRKTHHFYIGHIRTCEPAAKDIDGTALVWTDSERAIEVAQRMGWADRYVVVGMGDEKWALFQTKVKHRVVK